MIGSEMIVGVDKHDECLDGALLSCLIDLICIGCVWTCVRYMTDAPHKLTPETFLPKAKEEKKKKHLSFLLYVR